MSDAPDEVSFSARLRALRVTLKSGDYTGVDIMQAWCAMAQAADTIETLARERDEARAQVKSENLYRRRAKYLLRIVKLMRRCPGLDNTDQVTGRTFREIADHAIYRCGGTS